MMRRAFIPLAMVVAALAGRWGFSQENDGISPVLLPPPKPAVRDAHAKCPAAKRDCLICHPAAASSRWASDRLVPAMEQCAECHEAARDATAISPFTDDCRTCHRSVKAKKRPARGDYPRPNIRFSHKAHQKELGCQTCHPRAAASQPTGAGVDVVGMKKCLTCHQGTQCRSCHLVHKDGKMVTELGGEKLLPPTWLKGPTHGVGWTGTHATVAGSDSAFCGACHRESFCQSCHTGKRRPRDIHPGDWLTSHGVSTRIDNPRCKGCHRKQTFCLTCHRRSGVAPDSPPRSRPEVGRAAYHRDMETLDLMRRAKRDVTSCVSCHNESSCVQCHVRINPHPRNFQRKCKGLAARNRRSCAKCHRNDPTRFCR
jgi:hypothetical protein